MNAATKATQQFLNSIAYHLSGRAECNGVSYILAIGTTDERIEVQTSLADDENASRRVYFYPDVSVFANRHSRKPGSQIPVISHILLEHFREEVSGGVDEFGHPLIKDGTLVRGVYEYQLSVSGKKRRWRRVK